MKLALIQTAAKKNKEESLALAESYIRKAAEAGADFVLLPEMFNCPYKTENFPLYAEEEGGPSWQRMAEAARQCGVYVAAGSMPERVSAAPCPESTDSTSGPGLVKAGSGSPGTDSPADRAKIYNTAYVFDRNGTQIARHRKMHLFDIDVKNSMSAGTGTNQAGSADADQLSGPEGTGQFFRESDTLSAGDAVTTFDTEFGRFGLMICYDIRFPELARLMALDGAVMILVPGCFNMTTGPAHWELTFRARALDNQVFMAGCSQARADGAYVAYGHSLVTDPWGRVTSGLDEKEGLLLADIDFSLVDKVRSELPFLAQRRTDIYRLLPFDCMPPGR